MRNIGEVQYLARSQEGRAQDLENSRVAVARQESHEAAYFNASRAIGAPRSPQHHSLFVTLNATSKRSEQHLNRPDHRLDHASRRVGRCLTEHHIRNIVAAARHSEIIASPLNVFFVIRLHDAPGRAQQIIGEILERWTKALHYYDTQPAYVWVLERAPYRDLHCNLLLHAPESNRSDFIRLFRKQIARAFREPTLPRNTLRWKSIWNLEGVLAYSLKCCDGPAHDLLERLTPAAPRRWQPVTERIPIIGRRAGCSENIGPAARARFNSRSWRPV